MGIIYTSEGPPIKINGASSITDATENDLSFCYYRLEKTASIVSRSNAGAILCKKELANKLEGFVCLYCTNALLEYRY
jgi:UDP-3-O-[3-hydroxymyristoyl] glucosamine N-acyltransferase